MATDTGLDGDAECLAGLGQPLASVAEITQGCPFEAAAGKLMQHWDDALAVMDIRWRGVDRQREAVLVHGKMDFDALDLFAAIEAAAEASRGSKPKTAKFLKAFRFKGLRHPAWSFLPVSRPRSH